ncbi:MAG: insulinase family protein [Candidatus Cloacimonetes bacterium]|nr:insulinase family protein [Candidatus Cloacimonadota bacterium]
MVKSFKHIIVLIASLFMMGVVTAQSMDNYLRTPLPIDPSLKIGTLPNGLTYIIKANPQPAKRAELRLFVQIGSVDEDDDQLGLAHFTEHMVFKGTKSYTKQQIIQFLNSIGMGFGGGLNAMTSREFTLYTLSAPTDKPEALDKAFHILSEMGLAATFDEKELQEERGVIIEEWRMYQGASERIQDQVQNLIFAGSRYAQRTPIGTYEVLSTFTREQILRFYQDWYRPDLQTLLIVGDFDPVAVEQTIFKYFGAYPAAENPRPKVSYPVPVHVEPAAIVAIDDEMSYTSVDLIWKHDPLRVNTLGSYMQKTLINQGISMLNTRLDELSRSGNPPFSYAYANFSPLTQTRSALELGAYCPEDKVEEAIQALLTEVQRIKQHGFTSGELGRSVLSTRTQLERRVADKDKELSSRLVWSFLMPIVYGDTMLGPEQQQQFFEMFSPYITVEDINGIFSELFTAENFNITVTGPAKAGLTYPSNEELIAQRALVEAIPVTAYEDRTLEEPLMADIPNPGRIVKQRTLKDSGIRYLQLSNGIKVYALKTELKNNEVLFNAFSRGGISALAPEDVIAARIVGDHIIQSGFGEFDKTTLDKQLAGHIVRINADIQLYSENLSGNFVPKDMELAFQMIYQYMTNPRRSQDSFISYISKQRTFVQNSRLDPQSVFSDSLEAVLSGYHPYTRSTSVEELNQVTLDQVMRIFHDRFGDFSDFTFIFVGNFDERKLQDYCRIYLANLPTMKRKESFRNLRITPPKGQVQRILYLGRDEKCLAVMVSIAKAKYSAQTRINLQALDMLMFEKLRVNIRESRSGVYVAQTMSQLNKYPKGRSSILTILACAPDRYDELLDACIATMDSIRAGLVADADVQYVHSTLQKNLESDEARNSYFLDEIRENLWNELPADDYLNARRRIRKITRQSIVKTARQYMTHHRDLIKLISLPLVRP